MFYDIFIPILLFILGVTLASFGNVLIYRISNNISVFKEEHSFCPKCHHKLAWYDLFPIFSFIALGGKCRYCKEKISPRYIIVETTGGLLFLLAYFLYRYLYIHQLQPGFNELDLISKIVNIAVIAISLLILFLGAFIDHNTQTIPLSFSFGLVGLSLVKFVISLINHGPNSNTYEWLIYVLGFAIPLVFFITIYLISTLAFKVEPIGLGDVIVFAALGLSLGIWEFIVLLLFSSTICSIVELIKMKVTKERKPIPFIPYIAIGYVLTVIVGPLVIYFYTNMLGGL